MKNRGPYIKHIYWLTKDEEERLRDELAARDIKLKSAKGIVCTPLDEINKITSVAPDVWDDTCKRQGSWYRASDKNGLYLVISSFELEDYEDQKAAVITESDFVPPRLASQEEKNTLIQDELFKRRVPGDWLHPADLEKRIYLRWARRLGSDVKDYDFLYLSHTANHANFIKPQFFIQDSEEIVPYSIDKSAHLCSCCIELFGVLGGEYKKKLVAPCPGATIFARLEPDRYLLVEKA
ncbi:MAG: hypothetical protein JRJ69_09630 [Deltaproteobacteria bacterium]|nr:hypothetical protein [Deltaproteobacteria bacterium]MBW1737796.1 hypothetical protein [Deltaproteobacteria bacterium]MBW1908585.1 hypothetical protein [Deltaproteobacteria bacterium]MBW2033112.1 hypothetical protein [Deltaproteobacteria bacterium]MBW2113931.1 hypothetical protein [Deltaproteobacteria bacterium]